VLQQLEREVGANFVGGGRVFYRDGAGTVQSVLRAEVGSLARDGSITEDSVVFDISLIDLGTWGRASSGRPGIRGMGTCSGSR